MAQLPRVVVCGTRFACVVALVALVAFVAGVAPAVDGAVGAVEVALVEAGAATELAFAFATVPAIAKNEATLSPPSSHRLAAAG